MHALIVCGISVCLQVPVKKAKSHVIPENGMHICESPGECMFIT